ncbi:hypothetical protein ACE5IS_10740 [Leptospira wolffii]|uniref:Uncharacterized protein n=1 Tax=Leptospira wolffii TaxID=409998 RepID=A0ABV5BTU2_9LEPT
MLKKLLSFFWRGNESDRLLSIEKVLSHKTEFLNGHTLSSKSSSDLSDGHFIVNVIGGEGNYTDETGYKHDMLGLSKNSKGDICFVEAKYKRLEHIVDVSIKFHIRRSDGFEIEKEIESYNPFFGCDVHFIDWVDRITVLVYTEKHNTYVGIGSFEEGIQYFNIGKEWKLNGNLIGYYKWKDDKISVLKLPSLTKIGMTLKNVAIAVGIYP